MNEAPITLLALAALSPLAPVAVGLLARERLTSPRAWVLAWCTGQVAADLSALLLGATGRSAEWITYLATPLLGAAALWALSMWQRTALARLTLRLAIPLFVAAVAVLEGLELTAGAASLARPLYVVLVLGAAIYTLGTTRNGDADTLLQSDRFWMCTGLVVFFATSASLGPLDPALYRGTAAGDLKPLAQFAASLLMLIGVLCPLGHARAGALSRA